MYLCIYRLTISIYIYTLYLYIYIYAISMPRRRPNGATLPGAILGHIMGACWDDNASWVECFHGAFLTRGVQVPVRFFIARSHVSLPWKLKFLGSFSQGRKTKIKGCDSARRHKAHLPIIILRFTVVLWQSVGDKTFNLNKPGSLNFFDVSLEIRIVHVSLLMSLCWCLFVDVSLLMSL